MVPGRKEFEEAGDGGDQWIGSSGFDSGTI
jgi:hypothetical protein